MSDRAKLGDRMKEYEGVPKTKLMRRHPVVIRLDGKAFHTFTKGMRRPFDDILSATMEDTMKYLCENIQGCVLGYTQSDEITLLLIDYKNINTSGWFDYNIQKMCSIASSMATLAFNKNFRDNVQTYGYCLKDESESEYFYGLEDKFDKAMFDARVFSLPQSEVCNCFIWRQQDAIRNSKQMLGQANFSHRTLQGKSTKDIVRLLEDEKSIYWNELPVKYQRGSCCTKQTYKINSGEFGEATRSKWMIDHNTPVFAEDRDYVNRFVYLKE